MKKKMKIFIAFGTRPEAIKLVPVIKQFELYEDRISPIVCVTAQHREMLDQVLNLFEIIPQYDLDIMTNNQSLSNLTSIMLSKISEVLEKEKPDLVIVQGDTTTSFIVSLAAFYLRIPIAHIEAGLRTNNKYSPFPEEINRHLTSVLSDFHFSPTETAKNNLLKEGIPDKLIYITGNTVIDTLKWIIKKLNKTANNKKWTDYFLSKYGISFSNTLRTVLVTGHRRESFGEGLERICKALYFLAKNNPGIQILYPVHLNPNVMKPVHSILENIENVYLMPPLDYEPFVFIMNKSHLILTDSGGIQEEAPSFGKPVLVMRDTTERSEGIKAGTSKLVGTNIAHIISSTEILLNSKIEYRIMSNAINPYGDGKASKRICNIIMEQYDL